MAPERLKQEKNLTLFLGIEHCGIYPLNNSPDIIAAWYENSFEFQRTEEASSFFLSGPGNGRLEIMQRPAGSARIHVGVHVSDFEEAVRVLKEKGIRLREPLIQPDLKIIYLEDPDPEGNLVHLWWKK